MADTKFEIFKFSSGSHVTREADSWGVRLMLPEPLPGEPRFYGA